MKELNVNMKSLNSMAISRDLETQKSNAAQAEIKVTLNGQLGLLKNMIEDVKFRTVTKLENFGLELAQGQEKIREFDLMLKEMQGFLK